MTPDFRALCAELIEAMTDDSTGCWQRESDVIDRARALLAEPEAEGPTDEETEEAAKLIHASMRFAVPPNHSTCGWVERGNSLMQDEARKTARAVLARWGRPAVAPAPEPGEVAELVAALKVIDKMQQEWVLLGNDEDGTASPSLSMPISLRRFTVLRDAISRAATLLQQQAAPVAVSERLPGPEDCDGEGRCWMFGNVEGDWRLISTINPGIPKLKYCFSHWLPANALPLPAPEATND